MLSLLVYCSSPLVDRKIDLGLLLGGPDNLLWEAYLRARTNGDNLEFHFNSPIDFLAIPAAFYF